MISKTGIRAFSDPKYDYYELTQDLGGIVPKGAIFVHDKDDTENGSIAYGCLKLCWTPDGSCYTGKEGLCANTVVFHAVFKDSPMFEKCKWFSKSKERKIKLKIEELKEKITELEDQLK